MTVARVAVALLLFALLPSVARGADFTVTTTADAGAGSLREAVLTAGTSPGDDQILFDPAVRRSTITLSSPLVYDTAGAVEMLAINPDADPGVTISGADASALLTVVSGAI